MPFTLAHPAAVLPLRRVPYLQMAALMVGSVTPDLPYFTPWSIARWMTETHSVPGLVVMDVPLGMLTLLALYLLRRPLAELLSPRARSLVLKALDRYGRRPAAWVLAPFSVLVGAATHLFWDSFTHPAGWMVHHIAVLRLPVTIGWYTGELCHVLQYLSSVLGLAVLALWYHSYAPRVPEGRVRVANRVVLTAVLIAAGIIGCVQAIVPAHGQAAYRVFYLLLTRTMAWFAVLYLLAGMAMMLSRKTEREWSASDQPRQRSSIRPGS